MDKLYLGILVLDIKIKEPFTWMVSKVNSALSRETCQTPIGIFIFGVN